jgi:8-oxo-dGTP diphosphatase
MLERFLTVWRVLPLPVRKLLLRARYARFAVGVAALICRDDGKVMLVRRTYSHEEPWALPGGWLEGDEQPAHALERELLEETGLVIRSGRVRAVERSSFAVVVLLDATLAGPSSLAGFRPSPEVAEVGWFDPAVVARLSLTNARLLRNAGLVVDHPSGRVLDAARPTE